MGCAASKLDNEDTVRRCRERRRLMKEAVHARHHLAAAHADYCRSLRITGSALSTFAAGEPLSVSDETPAVLLHPANPSPPPTNPIPPRVPPSPSPSLHPPPPPPFSPSSPTVASSKLPHILSASSISSSASNRRRPRKLPPKLPHILSESSPSSSPQSSKSGFSNNFFPTAYQANSTYSNTPSQASSVWNWENFYPPSPPDSEFFDQKSRLRKQQLSQRLHHLDSNNPEDTEDTETEKSEYDFFRPQKPNYRYNINSHNTKSKYDEETEREEVQCSEWGDHDHDRFTTTSSSNEEDEEEEDDMASRSDIGTRSNFGSSMRGESEKLHTQTPPPVQPQPQKKMYGAAGTGNKMDNKSEDAGSSAGSYRTGAMMDMKMVVRHRDLKEIVDAIKENFDKAAAAGDQVSEMLEIGRAQLDKSFSQLKSKFLTWKI